MKIFIPRIYLTLLCTFFLILLVFGQDIHFSQIDNSPQNLNPALTGIFDGDIRYAGIYRNQWSSVPVPYQSFSASYDAKLSLKKMKKGLLSVGAIFNYDKAGVGDFDLTQVSGSASYTVSINDAHFFTLGLQMGVVQRGIDFIKLSFNRQYSGDIFDPNRPTGESFNEDNYLFTDLSTGFNWHYKERDERFIFDAGISIFHINEPEVGFYRNASLKLDQRRVAYFLLQTQMTDQVDMHLGVALQFQGKYKETILSSKWIYHISKDLAKEKGISIGINYRHQDAFVPKIGALYQMWFVELSYDINISDFQVATNRKGGPELSLVYIIKKVKPVKSFKACPIF